MNEDTIIAVASDDTIVDFIFGGFVGLLAWFFGGLDGFLKVLIAFSVIDYTSGTAAAWTENIISSSVGFKGIVKKCVIFTFVGIAHLVDRYLPGGTEALRTAVCLFYIGNEGISIIENADRLHIPIPQALKKHFIHLKKENDVASKKKEKIKSNARKKSA